METTLIIAIVAGIVSLFSAFITWSQTMRIKQLEVTTQAELAKLNSETQLEIERLKLKKEQVIYALEVSAKHSEDKEKHLSKIWSSLQDIKEDVNFILSYDFHDVSGISAETFERINLKGEILVSLYREQGLDLPEGIRSAVHDTKGFILRLRDFTREFEQNLKLKNSKDLTVRIKNIQESFKKFKDQINFAQMIIANERRELREKKFKQYLELMSPQETNSLEKIK